MFDPGADEQRIAGSEREPLACTQKRAGTGCDNIDLVLVMRRLRVFALGVKHDYQHTGVGAGLYLKHLETAARPGAIKGGEMGWILETNEAMNRAMEGMGGKIVKRYRLFEQRL